MKFRTTILTATALLAMSGVSVWASVESIDEKEVLGNMQEQGLSQPNQPVTLPESDSRAAIPMELLEELESEQEPQAKKPKATQGI